MEVKTQEQYEKAQQFFSDVGLLFWLGATDQRNDGVWMWHSSGEFVSLEAFWAPSKPSQDGGDHHCMIMTDSGFADVSCSTTTLAYSCEFE